jgi:hypothetical protein
MNSVGNDEREPARVGNFWDSRRKATFPLLSSLQEPTGRACRGSAPVRSTAPMDYSDTDHVLV